MFGKWGDKDNLVDGDKTATFTHSGCLRCFASNAVPGYWQVNLGRTYFVAHVKIFGVSGECEKLIKLFVCYTILILQPIFVIDINEAYLLTIN